jgi:hypothetical protein
MAPVRGDSCSRSVHEPDWSHKRIQTLAPAKLVPSGRSSFWESHARVMSNMPPRSTKCSPNTGCFSLGARMLLAARRGAVVPVVLSETVARGPRTVDVVASLRVVLVELLVFAIEVEVEVEVELVVASAGVVDVEDKSVSRSGSVLAGLQPPKATSARSGIESRRSFDGILSPLLLAR